MRESTHTSMVKRLRISNVEINDNPWQWLMRGIPALFSLAHLDMSNTKIDDTRVSQLMDRLSARQSPGVSVLKTLCLSDNRITHRGAVAVGKSFASCSKTELAPLSALEYIDVNGNRLGDYGTTVLSAHLRHAAHLRRMKLARDTASISLRGVVELLVAAALAPSLREVDLSRNGSHGDRYVATSKSKKYQAATADTSPNIIAAASQGSGVSLPRHVLETMPMGSQLTSIDLSSNNIKVTHAADLFPIIIVACPSLDALWLRDNYIEDIGLQVIAVTLRAVMSSSYDQGVVRPCRLRALDVASNGITAAGLESLRQCFLPSGQPSADDEKHERETIGSRSSRMDAERAVAPLGVLELLDLSENSIRAEDIASFLHMFTDHSVRAQFTAGCIMPTDSHRDNVSFKADV